MRLEDHLPCGGTGLESGLPLIQRRAAYGYKAKCTCCFYFIHTSRIGIADQHNCPFCLGKTDVVSFSHEEKWCCDALPGCRWRHSGRHAPDKPSEAGRLPALPFSAENPTLENSMRRVSECRQTFPPGLLPARFLQNVFSCFVLPLSAGFTDVCRVSYKLIRALSIWVNFSYLFIIYSI